MNKSILLTLVFIALGADAAIPPAQNSPQKILSGSGYRSGGVAGSGFTLLNLNAEFNPKTAIERMILDVGTLDGQANKGLPGYFQVELKPGARRVVIDFSQMPNSQMTSSHIQYRLRKSKFVKQVKMLADPTDGSLSLILDLKKPARLKVYQVPGEKLTSKVVLDLMT